MDGNVAKIDLAARGVDGLVHFNAPSWAVPSRNVQYHPPRLSEDRLNLPQPHSPSLPTHCTAPGNRECARLRLSGQGPRPRAIPYGVYDLTHDAGWVSVGVDHDTASFAVETLRRWWRRMGCVSYPAAGRLLITADGGGSNGSRNRLWKWELQQFADEMGLRVSVCHFPPGTSKWKKIKHRMFCHITEKLAGPAVGESGGGGEPDRPHDDAERPGDSFRVGREQLPDGAAG